jgi:RimJ/RimL family protein N-acetyltransferase
MTVTLRAVEPDDLPVLFEHQIDPAATEMAGFPARDREAFMAHWTRILADETVVTRAIEADGVLAGNVLSFEHDGRREVGYWIGREHWGGGIATAALAAFLEVETRRPLYAGVAEHNIGSLRVLEKCGFEPLGIDGDMLELVIRV